jgi:uncharacterized protein (TIGR00251 family)
MVSAADGGSLLDIRVIPRAPRSAVAGVRDGALLVRLAAPPLDGEANDALISLMAGVLGVPRRDLAIVSGERSRRKRLKIAGLTPASVQARLGAAG